MFERLIKKTAEPNCANRKSDGPQFNTVVLTDSKGKSYEKYTCQIVGDCSPEIRKKANQPNPSAR